MNDDTNDDSGDEPSPIDWMHLLQFAGGDEDFARETVVFFVENAEGYVAELEAESRHEGWKAMAHKLKGAARSVGAGRVAELALGAEQLDESAFSEARATTCQELRRELDRIRRL